MNTVEELERVIEQLPPAEFNQLSAWIDHRRAILGKQQSVAVIRDHSAFLNSYGPEDEGLYDDAARR